jgi:hypothetical protein
MLRPIQSAVRGRGIINIPYWDTFPYADISSWNKGSCSVLLLLFAHWHWMDGVIKWPCIAHVKHTRSFSTAERVRHLGRETDVSGATQRGRGPIGGDIGKVPLDPDIEFLTAMTMVGKGVVGRQVD